ncbi:MAG: NAD(P)H-hydrate dehydratase [Burkholderiales bacterium]|nr:NAD(P)H-hydrate dehydratase [Burkholderiales bacterium]
MPACLETSAIRAVEAAAFATDPAPRLMARAGAAAAAIAVEMLGDHPAPHVLVLAGPGNNGGDAWVVARTLRERWIDTTVVFTGDPERLPADARAALAAWTAAGGTWSPGLSPHAARPALVVDGLFGIGLRRPLDAAHAALVAHAHASGAPVLALDVPSGLDADTGQPVGDAVMRATRTATFIAHKPGLLMAHGPDHAGQVQVCDLGLGPLIATVPAGRVLDAATIAATLAPRPRASHKGSHGDVRVVGGGAGMGGAALLAGRAALLAGAGRVFVHRLDPAAPPFDPVTPELMLRDATLPDAPPTRTVLVVGCGYGTHADAVARLPALLATPVPLVLDADALNLIAARPDQADAVAARAAPTVVTPHPAEAARLLGTDTAHVQRDRLGAARTLAARLRATVLLKGVGTVIATTGGEWAINPTGNPGLAAAGMGDVLAGAIGALMAQGVPAPRAAEAGAWWHGAAADRLVARGIGPVGLTASEVALELRAAINTR